MKKKNYKIVTLIPYVDEIYCDAILGEKIIHKQISSDHGRAREININYNRHELQEYVRYNVTGVDLVLLMDSDVIATEDQLKALLDAFKGEPLALKTKQFNTGHVCCACCLMKLEDYLKIDYINTYVDVCQCLKIAKLFNVSYLEGQHATEYKKSYKESNIFHGSFINRVIQYKTNRKGEVENGGQ